MRLKRFADCTLDHIESVLLMSGVTISHSIKPILIFKDILDQLFI
jgi:hypothetical protein